MSNVQKSFWKRDKSLDHIAKYSELATWYGSYPTDAKMIAEQIFQAAGAIFWANVFVVISLLCLLASCFFFGLWTWAFWCSLVLFTWSVYYKIKIHVEKKVSVTYEMGDSVSKMSEVMMLPFVALTSSEEISEITGSETISNTNQVKNNAGSNCLLSHKSVSAKAKLGFPISSNMAGVRVVADGGDVKIFALADCVYVLKSNECTPVLYSQINWAVVGTTEIIKEEPPSDSEIVGETWQHVNVDKSPDRRFKENKKLLICRYGKVLLSLGGGVTLMLLISSMEATRKIHEFVTTINNLKK